jgi:DNA-binding transcriptional MerR regulator
MARRKLPEKLYRIGEVIEHTGLSRQTLHLYVTLGLIREKRRTGSGYRLFPPSVFADLERVSSLKKRGFTLLQIREILDTGHAPRPLAAKTVRTPEEVDRVETTRENPRQDDRRNTPSGGKA